MAYRCHREKHRHATHARVIFFFGGGGGGIVVLMKYYVLQDDMTVFRCDKKYQMFTLLKEKQYQVTFLCEKNESIILHKNHQSISNKP